MKKVVRIALMLVNLMGSLHIKASICHITANTNHAASSQAGGTEISDIDWKNFVINKGLVQDLL